MISKVLQRQDMILQCTVSRLESLSCAATGIQIRLLSQLRGQKTEGQIREQPQELVASQKAWPLPKPVICRERQRGHNPWSTTDLPGCIAVPLAEVWITAQGCQRSAEEILLSLIHVLTKCLAGINIYASQTKINKNLGFRKGRVFFLLLIFSYNTHFYVPLQSGRLGVNRTDHCKVKFHWSKFSIGVIFFWNSLFLLDFKHFQPN